MEAMGLIIIVLLVVTGIILMVVLGQGKADSKIAGYNEKLVASFVSTLPEVRLAPCENLKMKDAARACAITNQQCPCMKTELENILANSLQSWGYDYRLEITEMPNPIDIQEPADDFCKDKPGAVRAEQPIPISGGLERPAIIRLRLCFE